MAQTKLDLSDNKFEQLSNEILHLSGCTHVFGQFQLESGSTLSILSNHGTGKVLTSNSGGTATWQIIPTVVFPITGATNGLSVTGKKIKLGGALTGNTTIDILTDDLYLCSSTNINRGISLNQTGNELKLSWGDATSACTASISVNDLNVSLSSVYSGAGCAAGLEIAHVDNRICFSSTGSNKTYHDNRGFHYVCDYSVGADSRWLPDKGYVDSKLSGNTSASGERITKLICQVSHGFNVKNIIGWSGGTYNKAIANGLYDGEVLGIVSKCYNADCFDLTQAGYITGLTGLTTSTTYFLSDVTAGLLTSIEPTGNTHISKSVLIANSSTSGWVLPYAGYVITTGASAGGTWGSITGILSDQGDLQTCLNGKLASGGTAICATTAGNALKLNNQAASFYLNTGSTALCATTAGNALALCNCTPNCFLGVNATASDSSKLGGQLPAYYLNTGSTITCAADSAKLNNKLPAFYLNTGSTALCATTAINSKALCGCVPASFLLSGGTAINSLKLGGQLPAYYLNTGSTITCAADSAKLNNKLPVYYLNTGSTALCATTAGNALKLNNQSASYYLNTGSTALCATCSVGSKSLCGCVPASFLLSGGTAVNSLKLGGQLPAYYLNTGSTALCATNAINSACLGSVAASGYLSVSASISVKTGTTYGIVASDCGKILEFTSTGSTSIYLPTGLTAGFQADVVNVGGGNKTFCACTGSNIHSLCSKVILAGAYNMATLYYRCINNWVIAGNLC